MIIFQNTFLTALFGIQRKKQSATDFKMEQDTDILELEIC